MKLNKIIQAMAGMLIAGATALTSAAPVVIYDSLGPAVSNLPSLGYQATSTSELGDRVAFGGTARLLDTVTVRMSTWALASTYATQAAGYSHALTFNFYGAGSGSAPGAIIASKTIDAFIPFRPEAGGCGDSRWQDAAGNCFNGMAFDVAFDFSAMNVYLPDAVTFGLAFSTQSYGADPLGVNGPYNSLNFGLSSGAPTVGTDLNADGVFWNTSHQQFLTTGTAGVFGQDTDWSGSVPAVQITADVPEPASLALVGLGLAGAAFVRRRSSGIKN